MGKHIKAEKGVLWENQSREYVGNNYEQVAW